MKPALRIKLEIMTECKRVEDILSDFAHDLASFGASILAVGGVALLLFAQATQ